MFKPSLVVGCVSLLLSALAGCAGNGGGGGCAMPCASAEVCCDGTCVLTEINPQHCGGCGRPCAGTCMSGVCVQAGVDASTAIDSGPTSACRPTCASSQICCGTTCVQKTQPIGVDGRPATSDDASSAFNNCGFCGFRCDPMRSISCSIRPGETDPECACGNNAECPAGDVCVMGSAGYQCVNLSTSTENCGEVGHACAEGELCTGGMCTCGGGPSCAEGEACCGGECVDPTTDARNCGGCGVACGANAPTCQAGACVCGTGATARACEEPMVSTGFPPVISLGETCCEGVCVTNDDGNCGGCGVACSADETCIVDPGLIPGTGGGVCCAPSDFPIACLGIPGLP